MLCKSLVRMIRNQEIQEFLLYDHDLVKGFTHRTKEESTAYEIMKTGFRFVDSLAQTTDPVEKDPVSLKYWHNIRKPYGDITIVIGISNEVIDKYLRILKTLDVEWEEEIHVEVVFSDRLPVFDEACDAFMYHLPKQFVKGFFCGQTGKIVLNQEYNPFFDPPLFVENLQLLRYGRYYPEEK